VEEISSRQVKETCYLLGFDLCGIASVERFKEAPKGFHPTDVYRNCKSVIALAKRFPSQAIFVNDMLYTHALAVLSNEMDRLGLKLVLELEKNGVKAVSIPANEPYEHWEPERSYGRAILSLKHAAYLAGLGALGKNTLLINKDLGNMVVLGAVLTDVELKPDPIVNYEACLEGCRKCIDSCPAGALNGISVEQQRCRTLSNGKSKKGYPLKKCYVCRMVCPNRFGIRVKTMGP
jgi:epoxyqueuosine reductase